jgi:hypothetical protein
MIEIRTRWGMEGAGGAKWRYEQIEERGRAVRERYLSPTNRSLPRSMKIQVSGEAQVGRFAKGDALAMGRAESVIASVAKQTPPECWGWLRRCAPRNDTILLDAFRDMSLRA